MKQKKNEIVRWSKGEHKHNIETCNEYDNMEIFFYEDEREKN